MKRRTKSLRAGIRAWLRAFVLCAAVAVSAAAGEPGPAEYVLEGFGGRAAGMGEAQTAPASGAYAAYWNPAGLGEMPEGTGEFGGQYSLLSHDRWLNYFGCAFGLSHCALGLSWINFEVGRIKAWTADDFPAGEFSSVENTWILAAGCRPLENLNLGLGARLFHQAFAGLIAVGCGLDFGVQACLLDRTLRLGFDLQQAGAFLSANTGHIDRGPAVIKFGGAWQGLPDEKTRLARLEVTADAVWIPARPWEGHVGAEYRVFNTLVMDRGRMVPGHSIYLRAGCDRGRPTCGAGYAFAPYALDYALVLDPAGLQPWNASHRISLAIGWTPASGPAEIPATDAGCRDEFRRFVPEPGRPFNNMVQAYYREACNLCAQSRDQEAMLLLERALELDPQQPQVKALAQAAGEKLRARERLTRVADCVAKARQAEASARWTQAAAGWRAVLALEPEHAEARRKLAEAKAEAGECVQKARTALKRKKSAAARKWLRRALALDKDAAEAGNLLASIPPAKKKRLSAGPAKTGGDDFAAGEAAFRARDYARALKIWRALLKKDPDNARLRRALASAGKARRRQLAAAEEHYLQGLQCYQQGKFEEARVHWKQTLRLQPGHTRARKSMRKLEGEPVQD